MSGFNTKRHKLIKKDYKGISHYEIETVNGDIIIKKGLFKLVMILVTIISISAIAVLSIRILDKDKMILAKKVEIEEIKKKADVLEKKNEDLNTKNKNLETKLAANTKELEVYENYYEKINNAVFNLIETLKATETVEELQKAVENIPVPEDAVDENQTEGEAEAVAEDVTEENVEEQAE